MKKKKTIKRPVKKQRKPRPTQEQLLAEMRGKFPGLVITMRDRRAVIHWPATLDRLEDKKNDIPPIRKYGVVANTVQAEEYIDVMDAAVNAASQWPLCSCGSLCRAIPRWDGSSAGKFGPPDDTELRSHGQMFYETLKDGDISKAREHMEAIEARATVVLRKLGRKKVGYTL